METTVYLNSSRSLVGILNLPADSQTGEKPKHDMLRSDTRRSETAMIFINAGFLHRVGPYRLYTDLARDLATKGIPSLRFDLSGLGDSLQSPRTGAPSSPSSESGPVADIKAAMDFMQQQYGISSFMVSGLCSGADDSLDVALADQRVIGAYLIDGPGFKTRRFHVYHYLMHYPLRMISPEKWRVVINRVIGKSAPGPNQDLNDDIRRTISKEELGSMTQSLVQQQTSLMFLYTGGVSDYYNHRSQFRSMFPDLIDSPYLANEYLPESDHLFMLNEHRDQLRQHVIDWCLETASREQDASQAA